MSNNNDNNNNDNNNYNNNDDNINNNDNNINNDSNDDDDNNNNDGNNTKPHFITFPYEIIVDICRYLDIYSLRSLAISCKDLVFVQRHPPLWRHIHFTTPEEHNRIEKDYLRKSQYISSIPHKLRRVDDKCMKYLINMLKKYNLLDVVNSINLDFTSVNCTSVWESINGFPNLEEISLRGCFCLSLRELGTALTWFEPFQPVLKLNKLRVLWCKDMDTRPLMNQNLNIDSAISHCKSVYIELNRALKTLRTENSIQLDIGMYNNSSSSLVNVK
jgi:hypothetical protein